MATISWRPSTLIASTLNSLPDNTASAITALSELSRSAHHLSPAIESHANGDRSSLRINRTLHCRHPSRLDHDGAPASEFGMRTTSSRLRHSRHGFCGTPCRFRA